MAFIELDKNQRTLIGRTHNGQPLLLTTKLERPPCVICGKPFIGTRTQKSCDDCRGTEAFRERRALRHKRSNRESRRLKRIS